MTLRAGTSAAAITPPVGYPIAADDEPAKGIDDDLMTRCLILADDQASLALIALDIDTVPERLGQEVKARTSQITGIPSDDIVVMSTGNSTTPALAAKAAAKPAVQRYTDFLPDIVAGNVLMAASEMRNAAAGYTTLRIPNISCYRDRSIESPDMEQLETTKLLAIQDSNEHILATVISNPCPAAVRSPSHRWTADYPGALCWMLQQSGVDMPMFVGGDSHGIMPFDWYDGNPNPSHPDHSADDANALALIVATQIAQALSRIIPRRNVGSTGLIAPFIETRLNAK